MTFFTDVTEYLNSFVTYMGTIEWQDYTEIVIIAVLLYYMIKWIHASRAWSLLKGLLVIVVFIGLAKLFHMDTILWLSSNILQFAVIALIVVLQPELRKALESLGKSNVIGGMFVFGQKPAEEILSKQSINEIVRACSQMARVRTGALIVIENKESISRIDETGIKVDADITNQLIINIFEKNTPLHDGAVTIRNNRISAATCYLPLTQSQSISKELGTRHRAGMGMSEEYDAVVIIVSEETGRISAAHEGQLERNLSEDALKNYLISELGLVTEEENEEASRRRRRRK